MLQRVSAASARAPMIHPPGAVPGSLEIDMEDVPLTLADLIGAIVIGLALGALIGFGI